METSEAVDVLCEIRDIQRRSAQFQRQMITDLKGFAISVVALIAMIAVGGPNSWLGAILFFGGLIVFVTACVSPGYDLIHYRF